MARWLRPWRTGKGMSSQAENEDPGITLEQRGDISDEKMMLNS